MVKYFVFHVLGQKSVDMQGVFSDTPSPTSFINLSAFRAENFNFFLNQGCNETRKGKRMPCDCGIVGDGFLGRLRQQEKSPPATPYGRGAGGIFRCISSPPATSIAEFEMNTGK